MTEITKLPSALAAIVAQQQAQMAAQAEAPVRQAVAQNLLAELEDRLLRRKIQPAFDRFWALKGGVSHLALEAGR